MSNHPSRPQGKSRSWLPYLFYVGAILGILLLFYTDGARLRELFHLSPKFLLIIVVVTLLPDRALINYVLFRALGAQVSLNESYGLSVITAVANQLPLAGGILAKGTYLKRQYELPYSRYLYATVAFYIYSVCGAGIIGLTGTFFLSVWQSSHINWLLIGTFSLMAASPLTLTVPLHRIKLPARLLTLLHRALEGRTIFVGNYRLTGLLVTLMCLSVILFAVRLWAAFNLTSTPVSIVYCVILSAATLLTQLVSIAPGGLGVREALVAGIGLTVNLDPTISVFVVGIERIVSVSIMALLGLGYAFILGRKMQAATTPIQVKEPSNESV